MSLDLYITAVRTTTVYDSNITHDLSRMAAECGLYESLWNSHGKRAGDLIEPVSQGIARLVLEPERFRKFDPPNGWGDFNALEKFARDFLAACIDNPDGIVEVSR